jgi:hypothetical protein
LRFYIYDVMVYRVKYKKTTYIKYK